MRVLVAIADAKERARFVSVLSAANHEVSEAASTLVATRMFEQAFEVAFVDHALVARARQAPQRIYVIAIVPATPTNGDFWTSFGAGADDVMRVTGPKDEILGRAGAPARIRSWAAPAPGLGSRLSKYPLWEKLEQIVGGELGEMLSTQMTLGAYAAGEIVAAAELPLTLPDEQIHVRVGFGVDARSLEVLQQTLLGGDTSPEAAADALREMANIAGGAIKRAGLEQGLELTIGLPSSRNVLADSGERRTWNLDGQSGISAGMTLACVAIASASLPKTVITKDLREGMVVARDVRNQMGMLIVPAGTNLTRTTVEQLGRLLGASATLEVTDAAA